MARPKIYTDEELKERRKIRKGTDTKMTDHQCSEAFILIDSALIEYPYDIGTKEIPRKFKFVTIGSSIDKATAYDAIPNTVSIRPWAPGNFSAVQSGADWIISWSGRNQFEPELVDSGPVPQPYKFGGFSLSILNTGSPASVRTITQQTTSYTYLESEQVADFGSAQSSIDARIAQLDQRVGPGYYTTLVPEAAGSPAVCGSPISPPIGSPGAGSPVGGSPTGSPPVGFTAEAVTFDGTNDFASRGASLTGISDSKVGTVSIWIRPTAAVLDDILLCHPGTTNHGIEIRYRSDRAFQVACKNASGTTILNHIGSSQLLTLNAWNHVIVSWDLATTTSRMYVNDVLATSPTTATNDTIDYTQNDWDLGYSSQTAGRIMSADVSEIYFTTEYIDLSVQSNRRKWIDGIGSGAAPVDLGSDGSTPTGTQPLIYFKGDASTWNAGTNAGSGGDFSMSGAVTDSSNEPVELP